MKKNLQTHFENRKDPFVQRYQILLNHMQRERDLEKKAEQIRAKVLQQEPKEDSVGTLKSYFDKYIKHIGLDPTKKPPPVVVEPE